MKHLYKKLNLIEGGGKKSKPKPEPAQLKPPLIGDLQLSASYSYAEILDLISDGPIEGIVNKNGSKVVDSNILQGIYLDDTPIQITNDAITAISPVTIDTAFTSLNTTNIKLVGDIKNYFSNLQTRPTQISYLPTQLPMSDYNVTPNDVFWRHSMNSANAAFPNTIDWTPEFEVFEGSNPTFYLGATRNTSLSHSTHINGYYLFSGANSITNVFPLIYSRTSTSSSIDLVNSTKNAMSTNIINPQPTTTIYTDHFKSSVSVLMNSLLALYDNVSINAYQKSYINKTLSNRFGGSWINYDRATLFSNWADNNLNFSTSKIFIIKAPTDAGVVQSAVSLITNGTMNDFKFQIEDSSYNSLIASNANIVTYDFLVPEIDATGKTTGKLLGFYIIKIIGSVFQAGYHWYNSLSRPASRGHNKIYFRIPDIVNIRNQLASSYRFNLIKLSGPPIIDPILTDISSKYNYANILAEYREGSEYQNPFKFFRNILIDKNYGSELIGPFVLAREVQKILENDNLLTSSYSTNFAGVNPNTVEASSGLLEGSSDTRTNGSFSNWNTAQSNFNESAIPIKHIIYNPNVTSCFVTITINKLLDTLSTTRTNSVKTLTSSTATMEAGSNFPSIINIMIQTGLIDNNGVESAYQTRKFKLVALIQSPTNIDIGNPDSSSYATTDYKFISEYSPAAGATIFSPFILPAITDTNSGIQKRYIKIIKLSTETNSTLLLKKISLNKITEIIPVDFTYPYSAIVATKIDSRSFVSIPTRTFDCKLKKIKVPSNYFPTKGNGYDRRYYNTTTDFNNTNRSDRRVYVGDWDGTLKNNLEWTDNPAWILYDIITNDRYGLGQYIDKSQVDIFDLYKIGRFCDAVDDDGYFIGVPDNAGGLEPRFSCNILFNDNMKVFDALNTIAALFRGIIYYNDSQINFVDDSPKTPIALFTNTNVKDGLFNYTNYRRDEQFNSIEVVYIDRFDNFLTKVEYVEDEEDIRKRGIFKKTINANGVTSRAMARRLGKHLIFQTIKENQSISFTTGLEALLCKPGDLIIIEDDLKSLKSNFGKVLNTNPLIGSIRLNEQFITGEYLNNLTVYTPTGYSTYSETLDKVSLIRSRVDASGFYLNRGDWLSTYDYLTGYYLFSKYTNGFTTGKIDLSPNLNQEYAFYEGPNSSFCYFSTQFTGWVLGTGVPFQDDNIYNKFIMHTGHHTFDSVNKGTGYPYNTAINNRRGTAFLVNNTNVKTGINAKFRNTNNIELNMTYGLLNSEISISTLPQITTFGITGITEYEYGCEAFVSKNDINYSLLPFVKPGSVYRFQRKLADDEIYKVISIKEENPNEYQLICTKFNTGKYALIENDVSIQSLSNTYSYLISHKVGDISFQVLNTPIITSLVTGTGSITNSFYISGNWKPVANAVGYNVALYQPNGTVLKTTVNSSITGVVFDIDGIGNYSYRVNASGSYYNGSTNPTSYYDSDYSSSGLFIVYKDSSTIVYDRSFLSSMTIL